MPDNPRKRPPQDLIDRMCEAVTRLGNRSAAALELDIPRNTLIRYTRHISGSPKGGGFNPIHAHKHPERIATPVPPVSSGDSGGRESHERGREAYQLAAWQRDFDRRDREGREPIAVEVPGPVAPPEPEPTPLKWTEKGDEATATFTADRQIRTADDAMDYASIDRDVWFVREIEIGSWTTNMKLRQGQDADKRWLPDAGFTKLGWKISLKLGRILPRPLQAAHEAIFAKLAEQAPFYGPVQYHRPARPHLLEVDLFDVHFGKLAWGRETGEDYDLKIAAKVFSEAVEDILSRASGHSIDRIVLPVGQDYFNIDGISNATTAGTPQDTDGRFEKIIETGELAMIRAVERLRMIAPVKVLYVPGNHDRISAWHLCRTLWARFHDCADVEVDYEPTPRKYFAYHRTLIGFVHGNEEKLASLPLIMATECPSLWAASERREIHVGHWHASKRVETTPVATHNGVKVRVLQSLSGRDAWHNRRGYVGGTRAAEAFLFDSVTGDVTGIEVSLRRAS